MKQQPEERRCAGCGRLFRPLRNSTSAKCCSTHCRKLLFRRRRAEQATEETIQEAQR